jgi:hypothetical protein
MADFTASFKKIVPSVGETRVLLGWGLATAVLVALEFFVFSVVSGSSVSSRRIPVLRIITLAAGAYIVLMIRDLVAYYAGVSVEEMFSMSPVAIFGVLAFFIAFLIYAIHDIQDVGSMITRSSKKTGGNLLTFFFEGDEGFEDEEDGQGGSDGSGGAGPANGSQVPPNQVGGGGRSFLPAADGGMTQYGMGSDPFAGVGATSTRDGANRNGGQDLRDMSAISQRSAARHSGGGAPAVQQPVVMAPAPMASSSAGGSAFAPFL